MSKFSNKSLLGVLVIVVISPETISNTTTPIEGTLVVMMSSWLSVGCGI